MFTMEQSFDSEVLNENGYNSNGISLEDAFGSEHNLDNTMDTRQLLEETIDVSMSRADITDLNQSDIQQDILWSQDRNAEQDAHESMANDDSYYNRFLDRINQTLSERDETFSVHDANSSLYSTGINFANSLKNTQTKPITTANSGYVSQAERMGRKALRQQLKDYDAKKNIFAQNEIIFEKLNDELADLIASRDTLKKEYDSKMKQYVESDNNLLPKQEEVVHLDLEQLRDRFEEKEVAITALQLKLNNFQVEQASLHHDIEDMKEKAFQIQQENDINFHKTLTHTQAQSRKQDLRLKHREKSLERKATEIAKIDEDNEKELQRVIEASKVERIKAKKRLDETKKRIAIQESKVKHEKELEIQKKKNAFQELEKNKIAALDRIKENTEKLMKAKASQLEKETNEIKTIAAEGGNPYEVIRARKLQAQFEKNTRRMQKKMINAQKEIEDKMKVEEKQFWKHNQSELKHHEHMQRWKNSISKSTRNKKVSAYIQSRTVTGTDVIDPLGKQARIYPSKVVVTKDWSFGLGMASQTNPLALEQLSKRYPKAKANNALVPKDTMWAPGFVTGESNMNLSGTKGRKPSRTVKDDGEDSDEDLAEPQFKGLWQQKKIISEGYIDDDRLPVRSLTNLEKSYLEKKRKRNRENIVQKQICWGKEFEGQAFVPDPKEIVFKDFQVGETYNQKIKLTNASLTFNYFKVLPLDDEVKNFFDINYSPPGKMSAGTSSTITITFRPRVSEDIDTVVRILAQTGEFTIPLRCTTKKVMISVTSPNEVDENCTPLTPSKTFSEVTIMKNRTQVLARRENEASKLNESTRSRGGHLRMLTRLAQSKSETTLQEGKNHEGGYQEVKYRFLNFGSVMLAESSEVTITIRNDGALDTALVLEGPAVMEHHLMHDQVNSKLPDRVLLFSSKQLLIKKFSTTSIKIRFFPQVVQALSSEVTLHFEDKFTQDIKFKLLGEGTDVSIYLEDDTLDFKYTFINTLYRESLRVCNRGKIAMKCEFPVPKELKNHLEFVPNLAYVQPGEPFSIQVKFRPGASILEDCAAYIHNANNENDEKTAISIPIPLSIPNQAMPVHVHLLSTITTSELIVEPKAIDFGLASLDEALSVPVTVINRSLLPQEFGFLKCPREISVEPDDGFACVLPGESITFNINFTPTSAIEYHTKCVIKTARNEEIVIPIKAIGVQPPLKLSKPLIISKATAIGDYCSETVQLLNTSPNIQKFQFELSDDMLASGLTILPRTASLEPNQECSIVVKYVPQPEFTHPTPTPIIEPTPAPIKKGKKEVVVESLPVEVASPTLPIDNYETWEKSEEDELWSRHKFWLIPCYIKEENVNMAPTLITLGIELTVVQPNVVTQDADGNLLTELDFGQTALQQPIQKSIFVSNNSNSSCHIDFQPFEYNAFKVIKPPHVLDAHERCEIIIEFSPMESIPYIQELILLSPELNNLCVTFKGAGEVPNFELQPSSTHFDLGDALEMESDCKKQITLKNNAKIPLPFEIQFPEHLLHSFNHDGTLPFICKPSSGVVAPEASVPLTISFLPDHASPHYSAECWIICGADDQTRKLTLAGRSWKSGSYVVFLEGGVSRPPMDLSFDHAMSFKTSIPQQAHTAFSSHINTGSTLNNSDQIDRFTLQTIHPRLVKEHFEDPFTFISWNPSNPSNALSNATSNNTTSKNLSTTSPSSVERFDHVFRNVIVGEKKDFIFRVGNTKSSTKSKVDFSFEGFGPSDQKNGFSIDPQKFSLDSGTSKDVKVTFAPPKEILNLVPVSDVDVWVELQFSASVKQASSEIRQYVFTFRGHVNTKESTNALKLSSSNPKDTKKNLKMKVVNWQSPIDADIKVSIKEPTLVSKELCDAVIIFSNSKFDEDEENLVWVSESSSISDAVRVYFLGPFDSDFDITVVRGESKYDIKWNNEGKKSVIEDAMAKAKERFQKMLDSTE